MWLRDDLGYVRGCTEVKCKWCAILYERFESAWILISMGEESLQPVPLYSKGQLHAET